MPDTDGCATLYGSAFESRVDNRTLQAVTPAFREVPVGLSPDDFRRCCTVFRCPNPTNLRTCPHRPRRWPRRPLADSPAPFQGEPACQSPTGFKRHAACGGRCVKCRTIVEPRASSCGSTTILGRREQISGLPKQDSAAAYLLNSSVRSTVAAAGGVLRYCPRNGASPITGISGFQTTSLRFELTCSRILTIHD